MIWFEIYIYPYTYNAGVGDVHKQMGYKIVLKRGTCFLLKKCIIASLQISHFVIASDNPFIDRGISNGNT